MSQPPVPPKGRAKSGPAPSRGGQGSADASRRRGRVAVIQPEAARLEERRTIGALGSRMRSKRLELGFTLDQLVERVKECSKGYIISTAQISRIESGNAEPGFYQLTALTEALNLNVEDLSRHKKQYPWYMFSSDDIDRILSDSIKSGLKVRRHDGAHGLMIEENIYYPVPLNRDKAEADHGNDARMDAQMSLNVLQIQPAATDLMKDALDRHPGEEVIFVISGEIEFWYDEETPEGSRIIRKTIGPGGCLHYSSSGKHAFRALGTEPARALFVYAKPPPGAVPSPYTEDTSSSPEAYT